jgi:hypothetical protein
MLTLAVISGEAVVSALLTLAVFAIIFAVLWWFLQKFAPPEPFNMVLQFILALLAVVVVINALLSIVGKPFIVW